MANIGPTLSKYTGAAELSGLLESDKFGIVSVKTYGAKGDGITDEVNAFVSLVKYVNERGGNCTIFIPPGTYNFTPTYSTDVGWRTAIEFVDVENVTIFGYGAVLKQIKLASWTSGGTPRNQEGIIQFRSSTQGSCNNIKIFGITCQGDNVPYSAATGDGNCHGITFRGVYDSIIKDCKSNAWGTDGIYIGTTYSNTYKSKNITIENCIMDDNTRQGISIAGCDNITIINPTVTNTGGGSFGHAIDFEANSPQINDGGKVIGGNTYNNERGAFNFISSKNIKVIGVEMNEPIANGSIYSDGEVENISISECNITSYVATLYLLGSNIKRFRLHDSTCKTVNKPNNNATIRINFSGTSTGLDDIQIYKNIFNGTGGIYARIDGDFYFTDNVFNVNKESSADADCFSISSDGTGQTYFERNIIAINTDIVFTEKRAYILKGTFLENKLSSHINAKMYITDDRTDTNATIIIGHNDFSTYWYYKGEFGTGLNIFTPGYANIPITGSLAAEMRFVHGGITRVTDGDNAKVGDITYSRINNSGAVAYGCITAGSPGTWVLIQQHARKASTSDRPNPGSYDIGLMYLDTTLDADGYPIWWNGTKWIKSDATDA